MNDDDIERLLPAIPADVTHTPDGSPLDDESIQGVRRSRAIWWVEAGFRDAAEVEAWMAAGVVSPKIAGIARKRGFRPGDPWVPTGHDYAHGWADYRREPTAGWVAARANRRKAKRDWQEQAERLAVGEQRMVELAALLRAQVTAGSGALSVLSVLDMADATEAGPDPELVAGAVDAIRTHASAAHDLAVATRDHREAHTPEETASWFVDQLRTSAIPSGSTIPPEHWPGTASSWLAREAESMGEYVSHLDTMSRTVRSHLDRLEQAEGATAAGILDQAGAELDEADLVWSGLVAALR